MRCPKCGDANPFKTGIGANVTWICQNPKCKHVWSAKAKTWWRKLWERVTRSKIR